MDNMGRISFERSAYSKAGNILIQLLTHIKIEEYIADMDKVVNFFMHETNALSEDKKKEVSDEIIMCLRAGPLAEKYYCWGKCINYDHAISGDDLWQVSRLFYEGKYESMNFEKHIKGLEEETERLLKTHWSFVVIIAQQLLKDKKLTMEDINGLWMKFQLVKNA